jgi:hypothetical protein
VPKSRFLSVPGNYLLFGAAVLFVAALVASACPGGRGRLAAPDMSRSRGGAFGLDWDCCSGYAKFAACTLNDDGKACNSCGPYVNPALYEVIGDGFGIDAPSGGAVNCGTIWNGNCAIVGGEPFCSTPGNGNADNPCPKPPGPPPYEPP